MKLRVKDNYSNSFLSRDHLVQQKNKLIPAEYFYSNDIKMRNILPLLIALLSITNLFGQKSKEDPNKTTRSITSSTVFGIGSSDLLDTYLTPLDYKGIHLSLHNERMQIASRGKRDRINQQQIWVDYSSNDNEAENGLVIAGFIGYSWGTLWRKQLLDNLIVAAGPYISGEVGFVYNVRNGNNPASANIALNLGGSVMAAYQLKIFPKLPLTLRYQMQLPVMGTFFSPHYEQSYYEIFSLGNTKGIIHFGSFHNQFDLSNRFTIDIPIRSMSLQIGFLNKIHNTHVNDIKNRRISNSFLIGFTKEFLPFSRKKPSIPPTRINAVLF